ncbi:MAG: hypothetical protein ACI9LM_004220 [Alteromonadaceae bacterium]
MSNYNYLERKIAFVLSKFPLVKLTIKKFYQRINSLLYKKKYTHQCNFELQKIAKEGASSFFGYYDKSPINITNEYVIFQSVNTETSTLPDPNIPIELVLYDLSLDNYSVIDKVLSYNWQQGCKLMWLNDYRFIYNNYDENKNAYISTIYDVKTKVIKVINFPVYDCFEEKFALSLNFERLNIGRGDYAYTNKNEAIDWLDNDNDGLFYIDLEKNTSKLLVSIQDAILINEQTTMRNARHKFNHIMISPDGRKVMFMHRWFTADNRRYDALLVCSIDGSNLKVVANDGMVSHCCWNDNENIFSYLRDKDIGDKYFLVNIDTSKKQQIGENIINKFGDGHPSTYKNKVLFDTYPDKSRMKHLLIFDMATSELNEVGKFYESFEYYAETRCDLHPRFSMDGKKVFIDSVHENKRYLYMMNV